MFSSYIVSSVAADDNLPEVKYRTRYNNASIDIDQVMIFFIKHLRKCN